MGECTHRRWRWRWEGMFQGDSIIIISEKAICIFTWNNWKIGRVLIRSQNTNGSISRKGSWWTTKTGSIWWFSFSKRFTRKEEVDDGEIMCWWGFCYNIQRSAFSWPIRSLEVTMKNVAGPVDLDGDVLTGNHRVHGSRWSDCYYGYKRKSANNFYNFITNRKHEWSCSNDYSLIHTHFQIY